MKVYEVIPGSLYLSAYTARLSDEAVREFVNINGFTVIMNLWTLPDPRVAALVREYVHVNIPDGRVSPLAEDAARKVVEWLSGFERVLVHCRGGRNRCALVAGLALKRLRGADGRAVVKEIRAARPRALANEAFVSYLEKGES